MKPCLQQVHVPPDALSMHWQRPQRKLTVFARKFLIAEALLVLRQGLALAMFSLGYRVRPSPVPCPAWGTGQLSARRGFQDIG